MSLFFSFSCSVDTDIFRTSVVGSGFQKSSSSLAGKIKTYVAESHRLEAAALFPSPDTTTTMHDLYFECAVEPTCYDDTSGSCSGVRPVSFI